MKKGVNKEVGTGIEWGETLYVIPDFSFEEAILLVKPAMINRHFGDQKWSIKEDNIQMVEKDGVSYRKLEIYKSSNYYFVNISDGV